MTTDIVPVDSRTAIYIRVSTDAQTENFSIPYQKDRLEKYCSAMGYTVFNEYIDGGYSGGTMDRPAMQQLIRDANQKRFARVIVIKLDRFSRDVLDCYSTLQWLTKDMGIGFLALDDGLDSQNDLVFKMMMLMLSVFAEWEREKIKGRMYDGKVQRAKTGLYNGGCVPIGYAYDSDLGLLVDDYASLQVKEVFELYAIGGYSMTQIGKMMHEKYGWSPRNQKIGTILKSRIYIGEVSLGDNWYQGKHAPIIDTDVFTLAQNRLKEVAADTEHNKSQKGEHLLTGMLWCGACGSRMEVVRSSSIYRGTAYKYIYYHCASRRNTSDRKVNAEKCKSKRIRADDLDALIVSKIRELAVNPDEIDRIVKENQDTGLEDRIGAINKRLSEIERKIERYYSLYGESDLDPSYITSNVVPLQNEKKRLQDELYNLPSPEPIRTDLYKEAALRFGVAAGGNDMRAKRAAVNALINRIVVSAGSIEIHWKFAPYF